MPFDYTIKYVSENNYENPVYEAYWQFMVTPLTNENQKLLASNFQTSEDTRIEQSINGYNFDTVRIHCKKPFNSIRFSAEFKMVKNDVNPFDFVTEFAPEEEFKSLHEDHFKISHEAYLTPTNLTQLSEKHQHIYLFDQNKHLSQNLFDLNQWVYYQIYFKVGVTDVDTKLDDIIENRHGVCQDFTHLFLAIARRNNIPARYVSGYLHQGDGFFGDSQMHAWVEAFIPEIGWIGYDPTNNLLANHNHIKVSHGKDYNDCAPLKGIVFSTGENETKYSVEVSYQQ